MTEQPKDPRDQYEPPTAEDIDTSHDPASVVAGAANTPPQDDQVAR